MSSEIREMIILKNKEIVKEIVSQPLSQNGQSKWSHNEITRSRTFQIYYTFRLNEMVEIFSRICLNVSEMKLVACIRNHGNSTRFSTGYNFSCNFDNIFYAKGKFSCFEIIFIKNYLIISDWFYFLIVIYITKKDYGILIQIKILFYSLLFHFVS